MGHLYVTQSKKLASFSTRNHIDSRNNKKNHDNITAIKW